MKRMVLFLMLAAFCPQVFAANWKLIGVSNDQTTFVYVATDTRKFYPETKLAGIWAKYEHTEPQVIEGRIYFYIVDQVNFNCQERTAFTKTSLYYNKRGEVVHSVKVRYARYKETQVVPSSIGEAIFEAACFEKYPFI